MRTGEVFGSRTLQDGRLVTLRTLKRSDLGSLVGFVNDLVGERSRNPGLGILLDKRVTKKEEEVYLTRILKGIRKNDVASVAAEAEGKIVGNSEVQRLRSGDRYHLGLLGIAIAEAYRNVGLGRLMMDVLLRRAGELGFRLITLEAFASNERALHLYGSYGFKEYGRLPKAIFRGGRYTDSVHMFRQA